MELDAHLSICPRCSAQVEAGRNLGALVRMALPPVEDDPALRAAIMAGVRARAAQPPPATRRGSTLRGYRWGALATACLLLIVATVWRQPAYEAAEASLLRFVEFVRAPADNPRVASEEQGPPGARLGLPDMPAATPSLAFQAVVPTTLPHGLQLLSVSHPSPEAVYAEYADELGSRYLIVQRPQPAGPVQFDPNATVLRSVAGLEVLLEENPLTGSISRAYWIMQGVHFELSVVVELPPGLSITQAQDLIAAFASAEHRPRWLSGFQGRDVGWKGNPSRAASY